MNEVKIAVTVASLILAGIVGGSALKKFKTDEKITDRIETVETMEVTAEEDTIESEERTEAKRIYLEKSQSDIHCAVMHVDFDDTVYADEEPVIIEEESSEADESSSKAEKTEDSSKAEAVTTQQTTVTQNDPAPVPTYDDNVPQNVESAAEPSSIAEESSSEAISEDSSEAQSEEESSAAEEEDKKEEKKEEPEETPKAEESSQAEESSEEIIEDSSQEESSEEDSSEDDSSEEDSSEEDSSEDESSQPDESSEPEQQAEEPEEPSEPETPSRAVSVTDEEYIMLCNVVGHEYGANWISEYDKALVVEVIMNRVNSPKYPNSIYEVLTQPYQFSGMEGYISLGTYSYQVTDSVKAAVDLYLSDPSQFNHGYYSFWGDGSRNHFY